MRRRTASPRTLACAGLLLALGAAPGAGRADTCELPDPNAPYRLVFSDEFDGDALDRTKWNVEFLWGPGVIINDERQYYVNEGQFGYDPFTVSGGTLSIDAIKTPFDRTELYLTRSIYSPTAAELLWRVPAGARSYEIYRDGARIGTASGGSFLDTGLRDGIDYAYEVVALDGSGNRISRAQLTVNTADRPPPPAPERPFTLGLEAFVYSGSAGELRWQRPNRARRYEVYRDGALYRRLDGADFRSLFEAGLEPGRPYAYRVVAFDACDERIVEGTVTLDTGSGAPPPPETVARLVISVEEYSDTTAGLSWNAVRGARTYDVLDGGALVQSGDGRSLFVDDLVPGIDRRFRVVARDADGRAVDETTRTVNTADNSFARNRQAFLSGIITSYDSFKFRYGRVEARARMPAGQGLWSAFWLLNAYYKQDQPEDPEIDVIEAIGDRTRTANHAYHVQVDRDGDGVADERKSVERRAPIEDFSAGFHTYAAEWSPGRVVWFVDGVETGRYEGDDVSSEQMYLLANLAVGGTFPGPPSESTPFPASFEIDWIRVYQR